ncbi:MAG TPA: hypothetical protein VFC67_20225 [Prolixibacteraceae bacterium]|nr:hypothetical protein [Prolixibacteraceae bacterium]
MPNANKSAMREIGKAIRAIDNFSFMQLDAVETIENLERLHIARKNMINTLFSCGYELEEFTSRVRKSKYQRQLI